MKRLIVFPCMVMLLVACASQKKQEFYETLNAHIGVMTYDQAIQAFGPPTSVAEGDDVTVAVWSAQSYQGTVNVPVSGYTVGVPIQHGYVMQLTFGKKDRTLKGWSYRDW